MWGQFGTWIGALLNRFERRRFARKRCAHGMPGGLTRRLCSECALEQEQANRVRERRETEARAAARQAEARRRAEEGRAAQERSVREHEEHRRREAAARDAAEQVRRQELRDRAAALRRRELARAQRTRLRKLVTLRAMTSRDFEHTVAELYERLGYQTELTVAVGDFGADVIATREGRRMVIECKRYAASLKVNRQTLQQLQSAMNVYDAQSAACVTTSTFTRQAVDFARKWNMDVVDGPRLLQLLASAYPPSPDDGHFDVLCEECGVRMRFRLRDDVFRTRCPEGHIVSCDFRTP
jgi:restriction endonuclease Mrr